MSTETTSTIDASIEQAATAVGSVWPLHSFVTANPLAGFEKHPFHEAVRRGERLFGGDGYPSASVFRAAWESGHIDPETLETELAAHGYDDDPDALLGRMAAESTASDSASTATSSAAEEVDRLVVKWLAAFLDEGHAEWSMPGRDRGFYHAFRAVARYDDDLPDRSAIAALPDDPADAIEGVVDDVPTEEWVDVFEYHLTALPGWTGLIKQRVADGGAWQEAYPITLTEYLAVRLTLVDLLDAPLSPPEDALPDADEADEAGEGGAAGETVPLAEAWLTAWEKTYRAELVGALADESASLDADDEDGRPDAQLVFCIDTRSEILRRHLEAAGAYETYGYAGFFGVPMRYEGYRSSVAVDACPPILDAQHRITDRPSDGHDHERATADRRSNVLEAGASALNSLKSNAATAFSFVESSGSAYGVALAARTLLPGRVHDLLDAVDRKVPADHEFCEPTVDHDHDPTSEESLPLGLTDEEKIEYAASAFELMGWESFARLVVFTGHASETENNPFASSLDCGACAGNPGGPNARVLAAICNDDAVQEALAERGFDIPDDTVFVAAEHNTTTDEVTIYETGVPESHQEDLEGLQSALVTAREGAAAERAEAFDGATASGVRETERRAADWAQTRPEWGLAGNAAFVIGPRDLTSDLDLGGRSFLHSYDWTTDPDGDALSAIVAGPMVVTQWINNQYYFATVDNAVYGSGSKVTHNPVGNVGVYQGNGGDLMSGLPLQSVMATDDVPRHQPLRLSTVIHAPVDRVAEVVTANEHVATLLDNGWLSLTVVDPTRDHQAFHYEGEGEWSGTVDVGAPSTEAPLVRADD
jgi:hypothetical protein